MRHPSDSPSWKLVDHRWPDFALEPRNLRLAISADGPRQPGNDIDVYLAPLLDDLKMLWDVGVECYDVHQQELKDIACLICGEDTFSHRLKHGKKNSYTGKTKDGLNSRLDLLEMGLSKVVDVSALDKLQNDLVVTLCLLEKCFPPSFFDIMLHRTVHLARREHMEWLKLKNPHQSKRQKWLQDEHLRTFTYWLRKKAHGPSHYVSKYHGYVINGCRYHTKERDDLRATQNSGVSIVASTMEIASAKDQNPVFGELCFYGIITEI
ncbi:hypothetical protein CK203_115143 [Vitis vinifera]|uniref:DUF4218 domain-containing protein n=1 Tax=Vitis vinifera TaxID=29760 RepID=A0A438D3N7_VITVI|nr:hypothetical protein CK203_115143 [Vitis vinifera]